MNTPSSRQLRVAMVQMDPKVERVHDNIQRAKDLTRNLKPGSVDLVCFSEMSFTGYVFPSYAALEPYLENPSNGPTSDFCKELSTRLDCYVIAGYPERLSPQELDPPIQDQPRSNTQQLAGNSAIIFGPNGCQVGGYRKTNLYEADLPWAQAGTGFSTFDLPDPLKRISVVICMDLNPNPKSPNYEELLPYEVADFCIAENVDILIVLCAWKDSGYPRSEWDLGTLEYWCERLGPLWGSSDSEEPAANGTSDRETIVIICDRAGEERGTLFAGTSAVMRLRRESGKPDVVGVCKRDEESCRVWAVDLNS